MFKLNDGSYWSIDNSKLHYIDTQTGWNDFINYETCVKDLKWIANFYGRNKISKEYSEILNAVQNNEPIQEVLSLILPNYNIKDRRSMAIVYTTFYFFETLKRGA